MIKKLFKGYHSSFPSSFQRIELKHGQCHVGKNLVEASTLTSTLISASHPGSCSSLKYWSSTISLGSKRLPFSNSTFNRLTLCLDEEF